MVVGGGTGIQLRNNVSVSSIFFPGLVCAWEHEKQIVGVCVCVLLGQSSVW